MTCAFRLGPHDVSGAVAVNDFANGITIGLGNEAVDLFARGADAPGYAVPVFRAAHPNTPTAFDLMPNGRPAGAAAVTGQAWGHTLNRDLDGLDETEKHIWQALLTSAGVNWVSVGSMAGVGVRTVMLTPVAGTRTITGPSGAFDAAVNGTITAAGLDGSPRTIQSYTDDGTTATATVGGANFVGSAPVSCSVSAGTLPLTLHGETVTIRSRPAGQAGTQYAAFSAANVVLGSDATDPYLLLWRGSTGMVMPGGNPISWEGGTDATVKYSARDTGIARNAAGVVEINNGTRGQMRDLVARAITASGTIRTSVNIWLNDNCPIFFGNALDAALTRAAAGVLSVTNGLGGALAASRQAELQMGSATVRWLSGAGSPEGVVTGAVGSLYTRTDGGAGSTLYVKESGAGNVGWVAK